MMKQTSCLDNIECPYCGETFDGLKATNYDSSCNHVECPYCDKAFEIAQSIEYIAFAWDLEDDA